MKWTPFVADIVFIGSGLVMFVALVSLRAWRKLRSRRSPLQNKKLGHLPGQQLLDRIDHHRDEFGLGMLVMLLAFPLVFMIWESQKVSWQNLHWGNDETALTVTAILVFGGGFYWCARHLKAVEQARDGLNAERMTGVQLNRLVAKGCLVMHDLPGDGFNIDHIVIAPRAVYAIETKSFRKPKGASDDKSHQVEYDGHVLKFPDFATSDPLEQAISQAQWLRRYLKNALSEEIPVTPVVALPGWYINLAEPSKGAEVLVITPMGEGASFLARSSENLNEAKRGVIAQALAVRYPEIKA